MSEFISWATIVGGFSGLLSFIYVVYEKITNGPKIVSDVTSAKVYEIAPSQSDQRYRYDFYLEVDIGNIGTKLTSLIKPKLALKEIDTEFNLRFPGDDPLSYGKPSVALDPGYANTYSFNCMYYCESKIELASLQGIFEVKQIKGKSIQHTVCFKNINRS